MARFNPVGLSSNITNDKAPSKRGRFWGMVWRTDPMIYA